MKGLNSSESLVGSIGPSEGSSSGSTRGDRNPMSKFRI